jgi:hypothetical protein
MSNKKAITEKEETLKYILLNSALYQIPQSLYLKIVSGGYEWEDLDKDEEGAALYCEIVENYLPIDECLLKTTTCRE